LADALIEMGFSIQGINLGWDLLRNGAPETKRLLRVLYPFPYRELVTREAAERGIDPILLAALIRQESAFTPAIYSPAGAIGLMQVMPATGRELARGQGIRGFTAESLETAEINLHLGTRFLVDMEQRYGDGELPLVLSAYNAGPTRARRWRELPEAADPLRFTERIPFDETRGYVKNITRNIGLYQFLYGDG
jgi:soluble lytic murein transglycosylase